MNLGPVSYALTSTAPSAYRCAKCGVADCKMWRQYNAFAVHISLRCGACALAEEGEPGPIDVKGYVPGKYCDHTDQIGSLVPAVPTPEGDTFWGYASVPSEGVAWWRALPSMPDQKKETT